MVIDINVELTKIFNQKIIFDASKSIIKESHGWHSVP
jgi:hypothetical protein